MKGKGGFFNLSSSLLSAKAAFADGSTINIVKRWEANASNY